MQVLSEGLWRFPECPYDKTLDWQSGNRRELGVGVTVTNASIPGFISTGRWSHRPGDSGHFQVPREKLEMMRRAGVWVALRGTPFPTKGPTLLIMILAPILFISLSRHYVPMRQNSNGTKGYSGEFRSSAGHVSQHPSLKENAATSL